MLKLANIFHPNNRAKPNSFSKRLINSSALVLMLLSSASFAKASPKPEDARWFEIEIILLQQLMDHSQDNESFANQVTETTELKSSINLIERYLQNQRNYAFLLNQCSSPYDKPELLDEPVFDEFGQRINEYSVDMATDTAPYEYLLNEKTRPVVVDVRSPKTYVDDTINRYNFRDKPTKVYFEKRIDCSPKTTDMFSFSLTDTVQKVPLRITGSEDEYSSTPYLLSKNSLQLDHIVKSLQRSRQFRPLVHMAWRQPVYDRRNAIPVKVFAGDNLKTKSNNIDAPLSENQILPEFDLNQLSSENQQKIQQHLQSIISKVNGSEIALDELIEKINQPVKPIVSKNTNKELVLANPKDAIALQQWLVDGWFKVHLDHYLFINSEFNFYKQHDDTQAGSNKMVDEIIPFKQNRRVISGEVHYFDHPFMGMIVQIRRHKRPTLSKD